MRILIYPGGSNTENIGDLAMLKTALERLKCLWPEARYQVLADVPDSFILDCPGVEAIPVRGCKRWFRVKALPRFLFPEIASATRSKFPLEPARILNLIAWLYPRDYRMAREFALALFRADLLVLSGCGLINDEFPIASLRVLDTFDAAIRSDIPTVMLGQGIGPINNGVLFERAQEVIPQVDRIHLREDHFSLPMLRKLGVPREKIVLTGDDAIEMSFNERRSIPGDKLGINLRFAGYSEISKPNVEEMKRLIAGKLRQYDVKAVGLPILIREEDSDLQTIEALIGEEALGETETRGSVALREVISRTGECRIIITGSYHAGVFALSQGIPVVGIVRSNYYREKFEGLAAMFGAGCIVLQIDAHDFAEKLDSTFDQLWNGAELLREPLLCAAESQIMASHSAYQRIPDLMR